MATNIEQFGELFTFYRIFAFLSTPNEIELKHQISVIKNLSPVLNSSPLILYYNLKNGLVNVHLTTETNNVEGETHLSLDQEYKHLFDNTFGKYEQMQSIAINSPMLFREEKDYTNYKSRIPNMGHTYYANYFFSSLNATYINMTCTLYSVTTPPVSQILTQRQRKYYKELNLDYKPINNERL